MKTILFSAVCLCTLSFASLPSCLKKIDVFTAMDHGLIAVSAVSLGGNSEECVSLKVRPVGGTPLEVSIPAGTHLDNGEPTRQDILTTRPLTILAKTNSTVTCKAYGFCCAATKGVPKEGDSYTLKKPTNPKWADMANVLATATYPAAMQQAAIWTVSDNLSLGSIYSDNKEQTTALREAASRITGKAVPFYDVNYGYLPNEPFVYTIKELSGEMQVSIQTRGKSTLALYAPDKEVVDVFYVDRPVQQGLHTIRFRYSSGVLQPGTYTVALWIDGKKADERKIEI